MIRKRLVARLAKKVARGPAAQGGEGFAPIRSIKHAPPKKCIFCGGTPLTGEHIWSDWLKKYLPRDMRVYSMLRAEVRDIAAKGRTSTRGGDVHHRKVKCVCERNCNNGWMRELENRVEPIVAQLLGGGEIRLTEEMQRTLAGWVALKAIVAEYDVGSPRISRHAERQTLRNKQTPPVDGWRILMGYYPRAKWPGRWVNTPLSIVEKIDFKNERAVRKNSQSLTFIVGDIYFILLRSPMPGLVQALKLGPAHHKLRQIWPLSGVSFRWRPPALADNEAIGIADHLLNFTLSIVKKKRDGVP